MNQPISPTIGDVGRCPQCGQQSRSYSLGCSTCGFGQPAKQLPPVITAAVDAGYAIDSVTPMADDSTVHTLWGPTGRLDITTHQGGERVDLATYGTSAEQVTVAIRAITPDTAAAPVETPTPATEQTIQQALAEQLHRIADDIVRLGLPLGYCPSLHVGVLDSRADLETWAKYLGSPVQVGSDAIPNIKHRNQLAETDDSPYGPALVVRAQSRKEHRSEVEALRARVAELEAQAAGGAA